MVGKQSLSVLICVPLIVLSACVAPPYISVEGEPRAELTVRKSTNSSEFTVFLNRMEQGCNLRELGQIELPRDGATEKVVYVRPGRIHLAIFMREKHFQGKVHHVSFNVEADRSYLVEYERLGVESGFRGKLNYQMNYRQLIGATGRDVETDEFRICDQ